MREESTMKLNKLISALGISSLLIIIGCAKDKNMDDLRRDQVQESLSRITAISGAYSGAVVSKLDGSNLGAITLSFQARTDIAANSSSVSSQQSAIVSGSLNFKSLTTAEISFDNGFYDDMTGDFQVDIPITEAGGSTSKLSLIGNISSGSWVGSLEVKGQPGFGADLNLVKNAKPANISALEIGGARMDQIKKLDLPYFGEYRYGNGMSPLKMTFINRDVLPEQNFYKLFSPVRQVNVNFDLTGLELNFANALLDDKTGTLVGHDPIDQQGKPAQGTLNCVKFDDGHGLFGWNCSIQLKSILIQAALSPKS